MDHVLYLLTVEKKSSHVLVASMVWHISLLLMNSFNKTEAAMFFIHAPFSEGFPFSQLISTFIFVMLMLDLFQVNIQIVSFGNMYYLQNTNVGDSTTYENKHNHEQLVHNQLLKILNMSIL